MKKNGFTFISIFIFVISFFSNTYFVYAEDTTPPSVDITYTKNPAGVGTNTITASYSEEITTAPTISIDQQGTNDVTNAAMTQVESGSVWTNRDVAVSNVWQSVTYGNGVFVAVANSASGLGRVMTSPDGITWTIRNAAESNTWNSVTYGNGLFVAVSYSGTHRVMTSPDGITWTARNHAVSTNWSKVTYGNGLFVAIASGTTTNQVMTSPDGITWTARTASTKSSWTDITYGNGLFVAVASSGDGTGNGDTIMTSPDGITWTPRTTPYGGTLYSVTYGNGIYVAVGGSGSVMTSPDGITWTARTATEANSWKSVTYGNGLFVAVASSGTNRVMTSPDGITWTARTASEANQWYSVTYGNSLFVAVANDGTHRIMTSPLVSYSYTYNVNSANGSTYKDGTATISLSSVTDIAGNPANSPTHNTFIIDTVVPTVALSYSSNPAGVGINTITADYSKAIAGIPTISINQPGTNDLMNIAMVPPGSVWTSRPSLVTENTRWFDVTYGNNTFVAVGWSGVMTSPDGITWTARTASEANSWNSVTYGNGLFVAVSKDGTNRVMTSPDGITWTTRTVSEANYWMSVTYGNGLFVAVSKDGTHQVMTSPDGITWTARTAAESNSWMSVTYGNGLFVAVASSGTNRVMTSPDGITWTAQTIPSSSWLSITYGNGLFVAISSNGAPSNIITSPDGITWTTRLTSNNTSNWSKLFFAKDIFVAVANSSSNDLMTSPDGITWTTYTPSAVASNSSWVSFAYGNGKIVAVASSGSNRVMTSPANFTYDYNVNLANGSSYIDGTATVSLSSVTDIGGNTAQAPTNNTFTIDTTGATVALTYSSNPAKTGNMTITATYSNPISGTPYISIDQPGTTDIMNAAMSGSGTTWTYTYNINTANGSTYKDGTAFVSLSSINDESGHPTAPPTNTSFIIDTTAPVPTFTYSSNPTKVGTETITVTYPESIISAPTINIDQPGTSDISNATMTNISGTVWTQSPSPLSNYTSVTYGRDLFVAVSSSSGGSYRVATSQDGVTWNTYSISDINAWNSVTYGNGLFVAVASDGTNRVMTSPDGKNWTGRNAAEANSWRSVTYGNNLFVAVASDGTNRVMTSPDGITWTARTAVEANYWNSVAYGNGLFVAVADGGTNRVMTSPDGITWTARTASQANTWRSVTYGNGLFVAVAGSGTNRVMTSPDGISWTGRTAFSYNLFNITFGNGLFVAVSDDSSSPKIIISPDGINWTEKIGNVTYARSVIYGKGKFLLVGNFGSIATSPAASYSYSYEVNSDNGSAYKDGFANVSLSTTTDLAGNTYNSTSSFMIDTTGPSVSLSYSKNPAGLGTNTIMASYNEGVASSPTVSINQPGTMDISNATMNAPVSVWTPQTPSLSNWNSIAYGNGMYVTASYGGKVMTSPDGITWTLRSAPSYNWNSVTYGNGLFVVVGSSTATILTSPDGITWTSRTTPYGTLYSVTYGNGMYVAVGSGTVRTSPDGITWTTRTVVEANNWRSVVYGNGLFVAVSNDGTNRVMTSPDGITWTSATIPTSYQNWYAVTYGNNMFVVLAYASTSAMTSPDGITWTARTSIDYGATSVTYGNGLFVGVGDMGSNRIITSNNGINWVTKVATEQNSWSSVTYGNGKFVAVSSDGTNRVMTSPAGYTYDYTVHQADGSNYIDGEATVTLSSVNDLVGNASQVPTNATFEINTQPATVNMSYSKQKAGVGDIVVTATYNKTVASTPNISINQPGSTDISNVAMTNSGDGKVFTYTYTAHLADGSAYIDGDATISLSTVLDTDGNSAASPTNTTFTIDTVSPTASITYSPDHAVKNGDSLTITATFNEDMSDTPLPKIAISGSSTLSATDMTKVDATHYTYTYTVGSGNGDATIALSIGTDVGGNVITGTPTGGAIFKVDNISPSGTITPICDTEGNGCTTLGKNATPQQTYQLNSLIGTAADEEGGSGISKIEISIKDTTNNTYYNGTSFGNEETYVLATGTNTWSFDSSTTPLTIDHTYLINVKISDSALNTQIVPLNFKFTNSPPTVSNVTASQTNGTVSVTYDVTDIESSQTTNYLFYKVDSALSSGINDSVTSMSVSSTSHLPSSGTIIVDDEIISYTSKTDTTLVDLTRGALNTTPIAHESGTSVYVKANSVTGSGVGLSNKGTEKSITWNARTDASGYEDANGLIKVVAHDGSAGSMIGSLDSDPFILDVKAPTSSITFDAGVAGGSGSAVITIPMPIDISSVEYKISDDSVNESNPHDSGWVNITESTTIPWTFDSDIEVKTLKYQFRDSFGNISSEQTILTQTPIPSSSFIVQDTSNISANPPYYDMYIGWQAASSSGFESYKLEYATSSDNTTYGDYQTINSGTFTDVTTNYYIFRNLDSALFYRFRIGVVGTNGNTSVRSTSFTTAKPDGVQNYGEGGGGSVATAAKVENVVVTQGDDKNISVSYKLTDTTLGKKVNPSYESYVFYNIGITLPDNSYASGNLTLSDASKLKNSGYILINNEVIGYSSKSGNVLSGLTRGTWPSNKGRMTRQNSSFFSGTPVWVMASGTTPISITNSTIQTGQNETITWSTYDESALAGNTYTNVEIKVLVHDNQDALSGPLSNQNDFSDDGMLNTLDLTPPTISFSSTEGSGLENVTPATFTLNLSRAYPLDTTISYAVTGTATKNSDYTLSDGTITFTAGETTKTIEIPILNDSLKEVDETIIITLSNPVNGVLSENSTYTYTLSDDDQLGKIGFSSTESNVGEDAGTINIPVTLLEVSGADTTVAYALSGTATSEDYTLTNGTLTIPAGETTGNISIPIIDDTLKEENETLIVTLSNPTNAILDTNTVYTLTILDNDNLPLIGFTTGTGEGDESLGTIQIPISIPSIYPSDVSVDYSINSGSAAGAGVDYTVDQTGTITIKSGEKMGVISIALNDDSLSEEDETIIITLSNPVNAVFGENTTYTYTIKDNEIPITEVSNTNVKSTSALITWNTADFGDSVVYYGTVAPGGEGAYSQTKSKDEKVLGHRVYLSGLTPETKYYYKTSSTNLAGEATTYESEFTTTTGPIISNVTQSNITDTAITVTWTTETLADSYIYYGTDQDLVTPNRSGSTEKVTEHTVTLSNLTPESIYYFYVQSTDDTGVSEDANDGSYYNFNTLTDQTSPEVTDISTPIITSDSVAIVWKTNEPSDSQVLYSTTQGQYTENSTLNTNLVLNHLITLTDLSPETKYYYVIKSKDEKSNLTTTEEQNFTTVKVKETIIHSGGGTTGVLQSVYDALVQENEEMKARLGVQDSNEPIISNVEVINITPFTATVNFETNKDTYSYVQYGKETNYSDTAGEALLGKNHSVTIRGLTMGTEYHFKVLVADKYGNSGTSDDQTFKTKYLTESLDEMKNIENVEQFQKEIESTIESILPSLVPPFIDTPEISEITENSATIKFKTNIKAFPVVSYSTDAVYDGTKENPYDGEISDTSNKSVEHTIQLIGLKSNTKYHYMAKAFSLPQVIGKSKDFTFTTKASRINGTVVDRKNDSFTIVWSTDEPTSSIVEYKNTKTGKISRITDDAKNTSHSVKIENLNPGTMYEVNISGINLKDNLVEGTETITVTTSTDTIPPQIASFKVDSALVLGRTDRTQTIVSWKTDEPSTSIVYFEEGSGSPDKVLVNKQEDNELTLNHTIMLTTLKPGTVYRIQVASKDTANNETKLPIRTIITPRRTESIVDVIFKNFDETFNFINNVK